VKKSRLVFLIGLAGSMLIDDVEVRENTHTAATASPKESQLPGHVSVGGRSHNTLAAQTSSESLPR